MVWKTLTVCCTISKASKFEAPMIPTQVENPDGAYKNDCITDMLHQKKRISSRLAPQLILVHLSFFSLPRGSRKFQSSGHPALTTDHPYIMSSLHLALASRYRCASLSFNRGEELAALVVSSSCSNFGSRRIDARLEADAG